MKRDRSLLLRSIAVVLVALMLAALFVGGAQPQAVGLVPEPWDKLAHVVYFFVLALLLSRFIGLPMALVIVLALLVGVADEVHQSLLPGRVAGWDDWLADAVGTGLGLIGFRWLSANPVGKFR